MKILFLCAFLLTFTSAFSQEVVKINMDELNQEMISDENHIKVFNFWASWCGPCVKELPYFDELADNPNLNVTLVSLDFEEEIKKASSILKKKGIGLSSYLLDEKDFIDKVDSSWTGAIPATLILDKSGNRYFFEKAFTRDELHQTINNIISK
ncbi:MAG: TlpA disulfide reductase family protein [Cyclobacteriaceae bacterium]